MSTNKSVDRNADLAHEALEAIDKARRHASGMMVYMRFSYANVVRANRLVLTLAAAWSEADRWAKSDPPDAILARDAMLSAKLIMEDLDLPESQCSDPEAFGRHSAAAAEAIGEALEILGKVEDPEAEPEEPQKCEGCEDRGVTFLTRPLSFLPSGFTPVFRCHRCKRYDDDLAAAEAWGEDAHWMVNPNTGSHLAIARAKVEKETEPEKGDCHADIGMAHLRHRAATQFGYGEISDAAIQRANRMELVKLLRGQIAPDVFEASALGGHEEGTPAPSLANEKLKTLRGMVRTFYHGQIPSKAISDSRKSECLALLRKQCSPEAFVRSVLHDGHLYEAA